MDSTENNRLLRGVEVRYHQGSRASSSPPVPPQKAAHLLVRPILIPMKDLLFQSSIVLQLEAEYHLVYPTMLLSTESFTHSSPVHHDIAPPWKVARLLVQSTIALPAMEVCTSFCSSPLHPTPREGRIAGPYLHI